MAANFLTLTKYFYKTKENFSTLNRCLIFSKVTNSRLFCKANLINATFSVCYDFMKELLISFMLFEHFHLFVRAEWPKKTWRRNFRAQKSLQIHDVWSDSALNDYSEVLAVTSLWNSTILILETSHSIQIIAVSRNSSISYSRYSTVSTM